jgi:transposase-like protein
VLVELKLVELRYRAVIDVLDGMSVTEVAQRNGVTRQSVHIWLRRYAEGGLAALADKGSRGIRGNCRPTNLLRLGNRVIMSRPARARLRWRRRSTVDER